MGKISFLIHRIIMVLSVVVPCMVIIAACSPKIVYVKGDTEVVYKDSIITKIDSVEVPLPVEVIQTIVPAVEVWEAETSLAEARCELDTNLMVLRGELKNKQKSMPIGVPTTEQYHSRDSIQIKEIPVPVETIKYKTPKWCWWVLVIAAILLAMEVLRIFIK